MPSKTTLAEVIGNQLAEKMIRYQKNETKTNLKKIDQSKQSAKDQFNDLMNLCQFNWRYVEKNIPKSIQKDTDALLNLQYDATAKCAWKLTESPLYPKRNPQDW